MRKAVSVTLEADNLLWLRGQAAATARRSVSDVLDKLVTAARTGAAGAAAVRSVVGTIDLPPDDEDLGKADAYVESLFGRSLRRPFLVRERAARVSRGRKRRG